MCVLECLERMRVQEGLWREDRAVESGDGEPGCRAVLYAAGEVEAVVCGSNASQVVGDVGGGGVSGCEAKSTQRNLLLEAEVGSPRGLWPGTRVSWA